MRSKKIETIDTREHLIESTRADVVKEVDLGAILHQDPDQFHTVIHLNQDTKNRPVKKEVEVVEEARAAEEAELLIRIKRGEDLIREILDQDRTLYQEVQEVFLDRQEEKFLKMPEKGRDLKVNLTERALKKRIKIKNLKV